MLSRSSYKLVGTSNFNITTTSVTSDVKSKNYFSLLPVSTLKKMPDLLVWSSNSFILPSFLNKRIALHNGRFFKIFQIRSSMLFNRVGNLFRTKKLGAAIHISKKKKKRK